MDQGVLESLKRRYCKSLLQDLLLLESDIDIVTFLKSINMLVVIQKVSLAWEEITPTTIRQSWRKLISEESTDESLRQDAVQLANADFILEFNTLGYDIPEEDAAEWLNGDGPGYEHLDDDQIAEYVQQFVQNEGQIRC